MSLRAFFLASVLCLGTSASLAADPKKIGDWWVGPITGNEGLFAAIMNDSKAAFGQYCYEESSTCYYILATDLNCEEGNSYPVLVNGDAGASHHQLLCIKVGGKTRYAFKDFELIDGAVRESNRLGIAFPLESGQFQVSRFSLNGSVKALDLMRAAMERVVNNPTSTRDKRL